MIPLTHRLAHLQLASVLYDLPRQVVDPHITIKDTIVTKVLKLATVAALTLAALSAQAASEPAVIYDTAGKFDKSFNEAVFRNGVEVYNKDKGVKVKEFEPQNEAQREQGLRRLASRGNGPIVAVGFNMGSAVEKVATEFPKTQFTIIDMVVDKPNVQSLIFKEHEGSFLVGALAAIASKTGKVGFVGGMDIPLIRKFQCGYEQGAKYINPKIDVYQNMTGSTPAAVASRSFSLNPVPDTRISSPGRSIHATVRIDAPSAPFRPTWVVVISASCPRTVVRTEASAAAAAAHTWSSSPGVLDTMRVLMSSTDGSVPAADDPSPDEVPEDEDPVKPFVYMT